MIKITTIIGLIIIVVGALIVVYLENKGIKSCSLFRFIGVCTGTFLLPVMEGR